MRLWPLVVATTFVALQSPIAVVAAGGHLYIATGSGVKRYPVLNGVPIAAPDRVYQGYTAYMAVGADGTLYAMKLSEYRRIYVFPPGAVVPARYIQIPDMYRQCAVHADVSGLTADANGNLYVAISADISAPSRGKRLPVTATSRIPCVSLLIYGPHQHGRARPVQVLDYADQFNTPMSVDRWGNLFVAGEVASGTYAVWEIATPVTSPRVVRKVFVPTSNLLSLGNDDAGSLFALYLKTRPEVSAIAVFDWALSISGTLTLPGDTKYSFAMAVLGNTLYAGYSESVAVFDAHAGAPSGPLRIMPAVGDAYELATGP